MRLNFNLSKVNFSLRTVLQFVILALIFLSGTSMAFLNSYWLAEAAAKERRAIILSTVAFVRPDLVAANTLRVRLALAESAKLSEEISFLCVEAKDGQVIYVGSVEETQRLRNIELCRKPDSTNASTSLKALGRDGGEIGTVSIFYKSEISIFSFLFRLSNFVILFAMLALAIMISRLFSEFVMRDLTNVLEFPHNQTSIIREFKKLAAERIEYQKAAQKALLSQAIAATTQNLAHDVRKPFSMLKMLLDAISSAENPQESKEIATASLPEVNQAIASVEGMIQDVMQIGSNSKPNQEMASPEAVIDAAINEVFRIFPEANVKIEYDLNHQHCLFIDTMRVGRVFSNILVNAVQAMNGKGNLWIKTKEEKGFVEFRLGNAGSCIPKESLPKLFDAFFTSGKRGGTGLGLAIAQKVVNEHGGSIRCESDKTEVYPAGYVEFIFTLPISTERNPKREEPLPNHSKAIHEKLLKLKKKDSVSTTTDELEQEKIITKKIRNLSGSIPPILIVDDEAVYRNSLGGLLTNFRGGESELAKIPLVFAKNADEAMELNKQHKPFLMIQDIDLGMSSKNGIEVIKDLRREGYQGRICVHSNRFLFDDQKTAVEAGADSVLPKPMSRAHLFKLISSSLPEESKQKDQGDKPKNTEHTKPRIAYIDDAITFTLSWKFKLKDIIDVETFSSSASFLRKAYDDPDFLQSLDAIVTDYHFGADDPLNGKTLARELRTLGYKKPIYLASSGHFDAADLKPDLTGTIDKDVPSFETVLSWLK